jgi:glycosyltransferase involved in cell wall biosynthesis
MIWLSSYPRSGNTFFRNILLEVYGLESSSFYQGVGKPENYKEFPFVKTHMLPQETIPNDPSIKAVYLIRDGRDALVSMAHQRKDIYEADSDFRENFIEAMVAAEGSYFGGWSINTEEWIKRADVVIRFEDLIIDPIKQVDRLGTLFPLPQKNIEKLPTFEKMKFGKPVYGRGKRIANSVEEEEEIIRKSFRKGKAYGWKDELDRELQNLFWSYHRNAMDRMGYDIKGGIKQLHPDFDYNLLKALGKETPPPPKKKYILIEGNKLSMNQNDGVKRYLLELLKALYPVTLNPNAPWEIDLFFKNEIIPLREYGETLFDVEKSENSFNKLARVFKVIKQLIKIIIPAQHQENFAKNTKQLFLKAGLKVTRTKARISYFFNRLNSGEVAAKEKFEAQIADLNLDKYDIIHVPLPQHYEQFIGHDNQFLVTIHDLTHKLFSEYHTAENIRVAEGGFQFFEQQKAKYICISESTKSDVLEHTSIQKDSLHVVYEAADSEKFRPNVNNNKGQYTRSLYAIPDVPFLLTLSTLEPRKNLLNTIKAFDLLLDECPGLNINLVIGGRNGWKSKELLQLKHQKHIIFTGFINENDLPILYNEAEALCYVSHYEGFGLPPLEAMSCMTPVIYGDNSSMKELFEGYGLAAEPGDIVSIKNQMKQIVTNDVLKKELKMKSIERTFDFSWRQTAIDTLAVYDAIIKSNKRK